MGIKQTIERALFGYTTEEAIAIRQRWVAMKVDQRIDQIFARLADENEDVDTEEKERQDKNG